MLEHLTSIDTFHLLVLVLTIFLAAILRAFAGFGFALAALPVMSLFFTPGTSVSVVALLTLLVSMRTVKDYWGTVPLGPVTGLIGLMGIGTFIGAYLLHYIPAGSFQLATGVMVMFSSLVLTKLKPTGVKFGGGLAWLVGLVSGTLNGAIAMPGPPIILYAMAAFDDARKSRGFMMTVFLFSAIFAVTSYTVAGHLNRSEVLLFLVGLPAMLLGDKIGFSLFEKYGSTFYRKVALAALFAIGASVTTKALVSL
jgi:uncharacterized membrane protein YfcA